LEKYPKRYNVLMYREWCKTHTIPILMLRQIMSLRWCIRVKKSRVLNIGKTIKQNKSGIIYMKIDWLINYTPVFRRDVLCYGVVRPASGRVCPSHNSWSSVFHMIVALDWRKCHDLDSRLLVKGQGHYAHNGLNIVRAISFHWKHGLE
jgi:hypothetical protein